MKILYNDKTTTIHEARGLSITLNDIEKAEGHIMDLMYSISLPNKVKTDEAKEFFYSHHVDTTEISGSLVKTNGLYVVCNAYGNGYNYVYVRATIEDPLSAKYMHYFIIPLKEICNNIDPVDQNGEYSTYPIMVFDNRGYHDYMENIDIAIHEYVRISAH